jgi:hypothetical protein
LCIYWFSTGDDIVLYIYIGRESYIYLYILYLKRTDSDALNRLSSLSDSETWPAVGPDMTQVSESGESTLAC